MDNIKVTHIDGEPPIYTEMKTVEMNLESCILNSEEDYQYDQVNQNTRTDDLNGGSLSAEEINTMIMLNEGPNIMSSIEKDEVHMKPRKKVTKCQSGSSLRRSSDIKKILTNDLPPKGRFLSTKSLQRLSGTPKLAPKKRRYSEEFDDETMETKAKQKNDKSCVKKTTQKEKINALKALKRVKMLEKKAKYLERETKELEHLKMKRLKELESLNENKSLNKISKLIVKKKKDKEISNLRNPVPKVLKKTLAERGRVKSKSSSKSNISNDSVINISKESEETANVGKEDESEARVAISRSGRVRKIRLPSEEFVSCTKENNGLHSTTQKEKSISSSERDAKLPKGDVLTETSSQKSEDKPSQDKPRSVNTELLQNVLNESVESWFDISLDVQSKGKRTRRKFKIIPQADASDTEFPEEIVKPMNITSNVDNSEVVVPNLNELQSNKTEDSEIDNSATKERDKQLEDCESIISKQCIESNPEHKEIQEKNDGKSGTPEKLVKLSPQKRGRKKRSPKVMDGLTSKMSNPKKVRGVNRQITSFSKKRRRVRTMVMMKALKNYGEKIDFNQKIDPEMEKEVKEESETNCLSSNENNAADSKLSLTTNLASEIKQCELKLGDVLKLPLCSPTFSSISNAKTLLESQNLNSELVEKKIVKESSTKNTELNGVKNSEKESGDLSSNINEKTDLENREEKGNDVLKFTKAQGETNDTKSETDLKLDFNGKSELSCLKPVDVEKDVDTATDSSLDKEEKKISNPEDSSPSIKKNKYDIGELLEKNAGNSNIAHANVGINSEEAHTSQLCSPHKSVSKENVLEIQHSEEKELPDPVDDKNDFSLGTMSKCIPFKKRGMHSRRKYRGRIKTLKRLSVALRKDDKILEENVPPKEESTQMRQPETKDPPCRRKSYREIKLTPKLVDMIATSTKRPKKYLSLDNKANCIVRTSTAKKTESILTEKDTGYSNLIKRATISPVKTKTEQNIIEDNPVNNSIENYLQTKMEQNAVNFESSWVPGDLVWARFAGNPFWPSLILRDPFSNDEYSRVKYLGRLPRLFVHVQFLADWGRRAWGPEIYLMNYNGREHYEKLKSNLPVLGPNAARKDLLYHQAFIVSKKLESNWGQAVKEADTLICKTRDERITYMKIKYPLVKYAASIANGHLVPNIKGNEAKSTVSNRRKDKSGNKNSDQWEKENESENVFECVTTSKHEADKMCEKTSPKITLKIVRSPRRGQKRKNKKLGNAQLMKRVKRELFDDDYAPSDSGSNGDKSSEVSTFKHKSKKLFRGARVERVCQICLEIIEGEKIMKCKGVCQGTFHVSCADKMNIEESPGENDDLTPKPKPKRRRKPKKLLLGEECDQKHESSSEEDWRCNDCIRGENPCFVCKSRSGNRQKCCAAGCGKFYHQKCLKLYPQTIYNQGAPIRKYNTQQNKVLTEAESPNQQILSCPLHVCHTCASDNPSDSNMKYMYEKLVRCVECPRAYHLGNYCVPAGSRILNISQIICSKHCDADTKKSHVNISWCFICNMGGSLICCDWCPSSFHLDCLNIKPPEDSYICEECESGRFPLHGEVVWVKLGRYRWWPARILFPQEVPPNIQALSHKPWEFAVRFYGSNDHYWLSRGRVFLYQEGDSEQNFKSQRPVDKVYQKAVQEASRDYFLFQEERKQRQDALVASVIKPPPYVKIKTNKPIGKVQLGNTSQTEQPTCDCDPNMELPCSPWSDCLNRMLMLECNPNYCNAGTRCKNQCFEKREYPPLEPYHTETRGWGLKSSVDIQRGQFVIEYVGEVVDEEEFRRRMNRKCEAKDNNYYFLTIDKDRIIDAGPKGNLARFMNHSCSPNCETQKWTVNGDTRVGLFAICDIPAGTELTFNYNLDCAGNEKKVCKCEGVNCSGFIGVKAKNSIDKGDGKIKNFKRWELSEDECFVCQDGGELMVCDVKYCPKVYHLECVGLTEWPNEKWLCPRHKCSICNKSTKRCCKLCPNAFCFTHIDTNLFLDINGDLFCSNHINSAVRSTQQIRKPSYINRNKPVIEYEKPFTEKYRPPPIKERLNSSNSVKKDKILMEPNLTDNTPILVDNPLLSSKVGDPPCAAPSSRLNDGVSVKVFYVDEEGRLVNMDSSNTSPPDNSRTPAIPDETVKKLVTRRKRRTNIPRKKMFPHVSKSQGENKIKSPSKSGINFESIMIKSVEDKILDSKLNIDNICNIIGGGVRSNDSNNCGAEGSSKEIETGTSNQLDSGRSEKCRDTKPENKKDEAEVDRSRRSKYFKIVTPEKFIKSSETESNPKTVTDFNYIEFMHPLKSSRSRTKTDENSRK